MMKTLITSLSLFCCTLIYSQKSTYQKAWEALDNNKRDEAATLLSQIDNTDKDFADAYITSVYLKTYNGKNEKINDFGDRFYSKTANPYPYLYALWFNDATIGSYGKKKYEHQISLLDKVLADGKAPGTLTAAAHYQKGFHYVYSNAFDKAAKEYVKIGSLKSWQFVGPFENLSESGFYKNYGPLEHPEPTATFKSSNNADIAWFTPASEIADGWIPVSYQFNKRTAVVYAQNFIDVPDDREVFFNVGVSGSIKVWVNDELIMAESKERVTELDAYTAKCKLHKGTNRILVQLGYTDATYPNFTIRLTNEAMAPYTDIATGSAQYNTYSKAHNNTKAALLPHFAEYYFEQKVKEQPDNLVNYLLLIDVYLRHKKLLEARNIVDAALKKSPSNSLVRMKIVEILLKEDNRTALLEEVEKIKANDPESLLAMDIHMKELLNNEKYEDLAVELEKRSRIHGEDETVAAYKISILAHEKKYDELIKEAERLYKSFPDNPKLVDMMYAIKKEVYKDKKAAMKIYESFMKDNYNYDTYITYANLLIESGESKKGLEIKQTLLKNFPYDPNGYYNMCDYYFQSKEYDKAEDYLQKSIALAPYNETLWEKMGDIKSEKKNTPTAITAYEKSLSYDPNQYDVINKIRRLNGKSELYKLLPEADVTKLIKEDKIEDAKSTDNGYYFILDQNDAIFYPGGATEEYLTLVVRITNQKGVDRYKESSISYSSGQSLLIEKSEVLKKGITKIEGERNGNRIVFTNLEVGDVLVFRYRLRNYVYGRFGKEFWDKFYFGSHIYAANVQYNLLVPSTQKINYLVNNSTLQPTISDIENFKQYSWSMNKQDVQKDEPLMPLLVDVSPILHITTLNGWQDIANWYSDITNNKSEEDFEINDLYNKLFPTAASKTAKEFERAKTIYQYIEENIQYSSVSFRQSAFTPQRPSKTLITRLGDCKDLSSLFVTLCKLANIKANLVLVDTRDNGQKDLILPSTEFNHCIAKAMLDGKEYYIELTDNYLPFASLPNNLNGAIILEIPVKGTLEKADIQFLTTLNRTKDISRKTITIKPINNDLEITVKATKYGHLSSSVRNQFANLDTEKQMKEMEQSIAGHYKNNVKLNTLSFTNLDKLYDSVSYNYTYKVKDEVSEIGSLNTFRITYPDIVASLENFSAETRKYPISYWSYEDADAYETTINISAPAGKKFVELPKNEALVNGNLKFSLQYTLNATQDKLTIVRSFYSDRKNIQPQDYAAFKSFFEKIVKAEQKFIAYK